MSVDDLWTDQRDDVFNVVADIDPPSARIEYAYKAGYQAAEAAITHLQAQVQQWEEFDFERDNPKRLVEHILALMVERDKANAEVERLRAAWQTMQEALRDEPLHALVCTASGSDASIVRALALRARSWARTRVIDSPEVAALADRVLAAEAKASRASACADIHPMHDDQ